MKKTRSRKSRDTVSDPGNSQCCELHSLKLLGIIHMSLTISDPVGSLDGVPRAPDYPEHPGWARASSHRFL